MITLIYWKEMGKSKKSRFFLFLIQIHRMIAKH